MELAKFNQATIGYNLRDIGVVGRLANYGTVSVGSGDFKPIYSVIESLLDCTAAKNPEDVLEQRRHAVSGIFYPSIMQFVECEALEGERPFTSVKRLLSPSAAQEIKLLGKGVWYSVAAGIDHWTKNEDFVLGEADIEATKKREVEFVNSLGSEGAKKRHKLLLREKAYAIQIAQRISDGRIHIPY